MPSFCEKGMSLALAPKKLRGMCVSTNGGLLFVQYRDGQKVRIHFLQASKKQFPEGLAEDVEFLSLSLCRKCMRTF